MIEFARQVDPHSTIPAFFAGKNVFITGGSGFMGKVLIEKLLRACPEIGNVYILLREKYQQSLQERVKNITENILFDKLRQENPAALAKIVPIRGDVRELRLGISEEDRKTLIEEVSIVYHVAATVRFDETLADSILMNTRGTREVCSLVLELKNATAFLHVSTAYCQHDKKIVEEKLYPPRNDWRKMIKMVEETDQYHMKVLSHKIMDGYPNTYTYSKALAENVIVDMLQGKVPTIIMRPTIVVSTYKDPMAGWNDNMNGPVGLVAASGKGILRSIFASRESILDFNPVDVAINFILKATWLHQFLHQDHIAVYNCSSEGIVQIHVTTLQEIGYHVQEQVTVKPIWYPCFETTDNKFNHMIKIYLYHLLPAIIIDLILKCFKKPPRLFKIQRKIYLALGCLEYFMRHRWVFKNDKLLEMDDYLHESDQENFYVDMRAIDVMEFFLTSAKIGVPLIMKEDLSNSKQNYRTMKRMGYVHNGLKFIFSILLLIFTLNNFLIPGWNSFIDYLISL